SFRKKTIKRLTKESAADIRDSMDGAGEKELGTDTNRASGKPVEKEVRTYSSPFKKGQTVLYGGAKYKVQVPNAKADLVGIVPMSGGKVDLVRSSKLKLVEQKLVEAKSLEEIKSKIGAEVDYVDVKPYSHNIIGLLLQMAATHYGNDAANELIDYFELEELGWSKITESSKLAKDLVVGDTVELSGATRVTVKEVTKLKSGEIQFKGMADDKEKTYNFKPERKLNLKESMLNEVKGHHVLFTGFRDKELGRLVDEKGGNVQSNWNKKTSLVVAKDPNSQSGKAKKAREAGISVISREQLKDRLLGLKEAEDYSSAARMPLIDPGERPTRGQTVHGDRERPARGQTVHGGRERRGETVRGGHVVDELLDAIAKAIPFIGYTASVEKITDRLDYAFRKVAGVDWHDWRKSPRGVREAATATDSYAADNMEDLNKQVTSDDLEKLGKEAEKAVSGDEIDTLAHSHSNIQDEMSSDDVGNIGGTTLKVPADIKSKLGGKIDELRKNAELVRTRDGALADWQDRTANFFDGLLTRLNHGSDENVKMAAVEAQRVTSPMRYELPSEVWDFFVRGGKMRSLSDHFKEVKRNG
ncbi:hypothetical protein LCGC14_1485460, partial [marine sediment metagenome]